MLSIDLHGKKAVVTGSTVGIGLAIAKSLSQAGADVVINGRSQQVVAKAVQAVLSVSPGARVQGVAADLATADGCQTLVAHAPDCDILVNNLGIYGTIPFFDISDDEWQRY